MFKNKNFNEHSSKSDRIFDEDFIVTSAALGTAEVKSLVDDIKVHNIGQGKYFNPKGYGDAYEDIVLDEMVSKGMKPTFIPAYSKGPDIYARGKVYQLKCYKTAKGTANAFYENGSCCYPDQIAIVPTEQKETVAKIFARNKSMGMNAPKDVEGYSSYNEAKALHARGINSFLKDLTRKENVEIVVFFSLMSGVIYTIQEIVNAKNTNNKVSVKKIAKRTIATTACICLIDVIALVGRQYLRA